MATGFENTAVFMEQFTLLTYKTAVLSTLRYNWTLWWYSFDHCLLAHARYTYVTRWLASA